MGTMLPGVLDPHTSYLLTHHNGDGWTVRQVKLLIDDLAGCGQAAIALVDGRAGE